MFAKICGTTNLPDAQLAIALGADALGFIFAPSRRQVSVEEAARICRCLPKHVNRVGVFTVPDPAEIGRTVREAGLTGVQMHWPYDPAVVGAVRSAVSEGAELWQMVGVDVQADDQEPAQRAAVAALRAVFADPRVAVVLLDAVRGGASGGLGLAFSWERAKHALRAACGGTALPAHPKLVVAGGLQAGNVKEAILTLRPWGVDAVSGVEAAPGVKSAERLAAFVAAVREAEAAQPPPDSGG